MSEVSDFFRGEIQFLQFFWAGSYDVYIYKSFINDLFKWPNKNPLSSWDFEYDHYKFRMFWAMIAEKKCQTSACQNARDTRRGL